MNCDFHADRTHCIFHLVMTKPCAEAHARSLRCDMSELGEGTKGEVFWMAAGWASDGDSLFSDSLSLMMFQRGVGVHDEAPRGS